MRIHSFMHILALYKGWGVEVRGIVPTSTIYSTTIHNANVPFFDLVPVVPLNQTQRRNLWTIVRIHASIHNISDDFVLGEKECVVF